MKAIRPPLAQEDPTSLPCLHEALRSAFRSNIFGMKWEDLKGMGSMDPDMHLMVISAPVGATGEEIRGAGWAGRQEMRRRAAHAETEQLVGRLHYQKPNPWPNSRPSHNP